MEPINGLERLAELVRRKSAETGGAGEKPASAKASVHGSEQSPAAPDLEEHLRIRLRQSRQSAAAPAVLRRIVIEAMLAWEFRAEMSNEPKFAALVNQVYRHIESEPDIKKALEKLIAQWTQ